MEGQTELIVSISTTSTMPTSLLPTFETIPYPFRPFVSYIFLTSYIQFSHQVLKVALKYKDFLLSMPLFRSSSLA